MKERQRIRGLKDYTGRKFGRLTALRLVERDWTVGSGRHLWEFRCDCGRTISRIMRDVRSGHTSSCGCLGRDALVARNLKHGLTHSERETYRSWKDMRGRCLNPNNSDYKDYGGRGITVCERWNDFALFFDDMGRRPPRHTLDRINVNGNYEPTNCRWADDKAQANNKRSNRVLLWNGESRTLQSLCDEFGLEPSKVRYRLKVGWSLARALQPGDGRNAPRD